jgi:sucrose-phosphate synthase
MFIMHLALQGCLRAHHVEYGVNADTGGHIRYLLELVEASADHPGIDRMEIVTRGFREVSLDPCYDRPMEAMNARTRIVRLRTGAAGYLPKEALWAEHDAFVDALVAHIATLDRRPDLIHAHYADAGRVAAAIRTRLGIPYLFTAHSLGRVKQASLPAGCPEMAGLAQRIAIEEEAIAGAAGIVASSRDEAEMQYAEYAAYDPGRIRIIAPGSDLAGFSACATDPQVDVEIARFLRQPDKPVILAIARPVTKKNLAALVHAYGRSPALQEAANLVIVAGTRDDLETLEPEIARNLSELLHLIDRYDLHGKVAYPKHHRPEEIPAFYAHARVRHGVFVNPALSEPFGLTLLEAAASGLPVVATDSGGPNDIIETCGNGMLVDPRAPDAIAIALLAILTDAGLWERYSAAGETAVRAYDWPRHVALYADFAGAIVVGAHRVPADPRLMLVCDIDNTLLGCQASTRSFTRWQSGQADMLFGIATGRSFHSAMAILAQADVPRPRFLITSVGSEIYHLAENGAVYDRDAEWDAIIAAGWDRAAVAELVAQAGGVEPQSPLEQRRFKLSYFTGGDAGAAARVRDLLARAGHACAVIQSHGKYLDVLPNGASKGTAVEHVRRRYGLSPDKVVVAGDSGNDVEMLRSVPRSIIVANYSDDLASRPDLAHSYVARNGYARGVIEGVDHFQRLRADNDRLCA